MILLDTHVVLWLVEDSDNLGPRARTTIRTADTVQSSTVSLWEIAIKTRLGRLAAPDDLPARIESAGVTWLTLEAKHAWAARTLTGLVHEDPFDRQLVAQAVHERLRFCTADRVLLGARIAGLETMDARA